MARSFACNTQITQSILRVRDRFCLLHTSYLSLEMIFVLADPVFCISHAQLPKWCCSCEIPHMQIRFCSWKGRCCFFCVLKDILPVEDALLTLPLNVLVLVSDPVFHTINDPLCINSDVSHATCRHPTTRLDRNPSFCTLTSTNHYSGDDPA